MDSVKYNPKHEQAILGTMIRDGSSRRRLIKTLTTKDFHVDRHKIIFTGFIALTQAKLAYTPPTFASLLPESDWGGLDYLEKLEKSSDQENIDHHIERLKWDINRLDALENLVPEITAELKEPRSEPEQVVKLTNQLKSKFSETLGRNAFIEGQAEAFKYLATIQARKVTPAFRSTGFRILDEQMNEGFARGKLTAIAATSSTGKTTFAVNSAKRLARTFKVGYVCWESDPSDIIDIMVASELKIPLETIVKFPHLLSDEDQERIDNYVSKLMSNDNMSFLGNPPESLFSGMPWDINRKILEWVEAQLERWDRDIVFWDLFEKKLPAKGPEHIEFALNRMQTISKPENLNMHNVLLHQINLKEVERRKDKRPTRDAFKGTSAWIDVPDNVFGLYRQALYEQGIEDNVMEVICMKQRRGQFPWKALMEWEGEYCRIGKGRMGTMVIKEDPDEYRDKV